jgi:hypothetical protein
MLHPDLAQLHASYTAVLDDYDEGNLSYDDALVSIAAMTVVDGAGFVWAIDTETGEFTRAQPGDVPQLAQPSAFVPAQVPSRGGPVWAAEDLMRPPSQSRPQQFVDDGPMRLAPSRQGGDGSSDVSPRARSGKSLARSEASGLSKLVPADSKLGALLVEKKRVVLIAVACVAVVSAVVLLKPSSSDVAAPGPGDSVAGSTVPSSETTVAAGGLESTVVPVPPDPAVVTSEVPVVPDPAATTAVPAPVDPVPSEPPAPALPTPTVDEQIAVLQTLVSADRASVSAVVLAHGSVRNIALRTAQYAGYKATGMLLSVSAPGEVDVSGSVVSRVDLVDQASGEVVSSGTATWVLRDTGWVLAAYVDFN